MPRRTSLLLVLLSLALLSPPAHAAGPYLVEDLDPAGEGVGSDPSPLAVLAGGLSLWIADDNEHGRELWRTDGTEAGTYLLLDGLEGPDAGVYGFLANAGSRAFFLRRVTFSTDEIWVTGGTPGDTFRVSGPLELAPLPQVLWMPNQGILYFGAGDEAAGEELWRSDGTPGGTYRIADLRPGPEGSNPVELTAFRGRVFFRANDGSRGSALWSTDGTAAGTRLVRAAAAGAPPLAPNGLTVLGNRLLFFGTTAATGRELWTSDGTRSGTRLLGDFIPGAKGLSGWNLNVAGGRLWFVGIDPVRGAELWVTNGTAAGTRRLTNFINPSPFSADLVQQGSWVGGRFLIPAYDPAHGLELWSSNGTPAGTRLLRDLCPGSCSGVETDSMPIFAGRLYFLGSDGTHGAEPWSTNGTAAGTRLLHDICPGACSSWAFGFQRLGGVLLFGANDGAHNYEIWRTAGQGAVRVSDLEEPLDFFAIPGRDNLVFSHLEKATGMELWSTDGTRAGTRLLQDINPALFGGSFPSHFQDVDGKLWFVTAKPEHALWRSDGTAPGTVRIYAFGAGEFLMDLQKGAVFAESQGLVFFIVSTGTSTATSVWRTDGTAGGTFRVTPEDMRIPDGRALVAAGGNVYFLGTREDRIELWTTDGTVEGTAQLTDAPFQTLGSAPRELTAFAGKLFFSADAGTGRALWRSDGTLQGTETVGDLDLLAGSILGVHAGRLWLTAEGPGTDAGTELWSTDGTAAGTLFLGDLVPGSSPFLPDRMISSGGRMFFSVIATSAERGLWVSDGTFQGTRKIGPSPILGVSKRAFAVVGGRLFYHHFPDGKLWVSDGTAAGTRPVVDIPSSGSPVELAALAGQLYFTDRLELWRTDGTAAGTSRVPFPNGVHEVREPTASAGHLFFRATDPVHGIELWALE